ncbi:MAG: hypothetical protein LQ350_004218 [Teloschistes chrysophthalmus]|nr:MAG: hypothetical protein LQ350_004218 [Niorma chrysophthalma]
MVDTPFQPSFQPAVGTSESASIQAIIDALGMMPHPEGGYFVETDRDPRQVPNPFSASKSNATDGAASDSLTRSASTTIFYLLTPSSPQGHFHRNKARTMHTLHKGRGRYVIVHADEEGHTKPVRMETFVVGQNIHKGERLQWMVEGGKHKASYLLSDQEGEGEPSSEEGLLISEMFLSRDTRFTERKISPEVRKMSPRIPLRIDPAAAAPAPAVLTLANASAPPPSSCTHFTSMKSPILNPIFHRIGANPLLTGSQTLGQFREMLSSASSQAESGSDIEFYPRHPLDRPGAAGPVAFLDGPSGEGQRGGEGVTDGAEVVGNHGNDENEQGESSNTTPPPPPPSTPTQQEQPKTPSPLQNTAASFERSDLQQLHRLVPELERSTITWNPRRRDPEQRRGTTGTWNPNSPDLSLSPSPPQQQQEEEPTNQRPTPEQPAPLRRGGWERGGRREYPESNTAVGIPPADRTESPAYVGGGAGEV